MDAANLAKLGLDLDSELQSSGRRSSLLHSMKFILTLKPERYRLIWTSADNDVNLLIKNVRYLSNEQPMKSLKKPQDAAFI